MDLSRLSTPQRVSLGAAVAVVLGAFLPWVSIFGVSVRGIEGDGVITLVLALVGGAAVLLTSGALTRQLGSRKVGQVFSLVAACLVALIGLVDMNGAAAIGLYLTLFAGIAWVAMAVWDLAAKTPAPSRGEP